MRHNGYGVGFLTIKQVEMNITEIANRIANLHYPDIPKTRGDKMCRRQRVIELQKLVESELKNCSIPNEGQGEQLCPNKKPKIVGGFDNDHNDSFRNID